MKVLLKEDVDNLGYAGEVHEVANGYGRNYLLPRGLAVKASPSVMKQAEFWRVKAEARREQLRAEYEALAEKIRAVTLEFERKAGETGKLFGSVTMNDIVDALNEALGTDIERRKVEGEPLRQIGEHAVKVRLSAEIQPEVNVMIRPEGGELLPDEEEAEAEDELDDLVDEDEEASADESDDAVDDDAAEDDDSLDEFDEYEDYFEDEFDG